MKQNKKAYSVIIALLMTGFLLVVVVGVFNLVLKELNDNRGMGNYIKTFYGAEAGQELALLQIKDKGYGYSDKIDLSINDKSVILSDNSTDKDLFEPSKETIVSYDLSLRSNDYTGTLGDLGYDIIPLYYLTGTTNITEEKVTNLVINLESGDENNLVWNIIGENHGFSGIGEFNGNDSVDIKKLDISDNSFYIELSTITSFLNSSDTNFLVLLNSGDSDLTYNLKTINNDEYFSKPNLKIFSSSKIGNYKQNLSTDFDNTEYFKILKYSIFSK